MIHEQEGTAQGATSPAVAAETMARVLFLEVPMGFETAPFSQKKSWQGLVLWGCVIQGLNNKFQYHLHLSSSLSWKNDEIRGQPWAGLHSLWQAGKGSLNVIHRGEASQSSFQMSSIKEFSPFG